MSNLSCKLRFEAHAEAPADTPAPGSRPPEAGARSQRPGSVFWPLLPALRGSRGAAGRGRGAAGWDFVVVFPARSVGARGGGGTTTTPPAAAPRGGGCGRGTKVRVPGRRWNEGRRKPPGKAEPGGEPGLKVDCGPGEDCALRGLSPGQSIPGPAVPRVPGWVPPALGPARASPGAARRCQVERPLGRVRAAPVAGGPLSAGGFGMPAARGRDPPKPLLILGAVPSRDELQDACGQGRGTPGERASSPGLIQPVAASLRSTARSRGRGKAGRSKGCGRARVGTQVHWGLTVPGVDHPPASPATGSPGAGVRALPGPSGAWGPFPAVKQVCKMPVLINSDELHPPRLKDPRECEERAPD